MAQPRILVPVKKCRRRPGAYRLPKRMLLASSHSSDRLPLKQLAGDLTKLGVDARVRIAKRRPAEADVYCLRTKKVKKPEDYEITVGPGGVEIRAFWAPGSYYGIQTLRDLLAIHGRTLPAQAIEDQPDFRRRGVYYDCSRGKVPTVKTVCQLVERLAHWKINELQLYIENVFQYTKHPAIGVGFSPFSAKDILRIQAHAKAHHVKLVGSLTSFGHMEKILRLP